MGQMMILCFVFMCGSVYVYELHTFHALDISKNCAN